GQETVQLHLDSTYVLHVKIEAIIVGVVVQLHAVAVGVLNALEPILALEAWITRRFPGLDAAEESRHCLIQPSQRMLQTAGVQDEIRESIAPIPEVRPLTNRTLPFACRLVSVLALAQRGVVDLAVLFEQAFKRLTFTLTRIQAIFVGAIHGLDILLCGDVR